MPRPDCHLVLPMSENSLEKKYLRTCGAVLSAAQTAKILSHTNTASLAKARARRSLSFQMFLLPKRRRWFANTVDVAAFMSSQRHRPSPSRFSVCLRARCDGELAYAGCALRGPGPASLVTGLA